MTSRLEGVLLAFDTSGPTGSVAVSRGGEELATAKMTEQGAHSRELLPAIRQTLDRAGVRLDDVTGVVVGGGPGSFTGVRVAAATAKGLVRSRGVPLVAISSLTGAALAIAGDGARYALFDARSERVYGACVELDHGKFRFVHGPHAGEIKDVLERPVPRGAIFVGDGAAKHRSRIEDAGFSVSGAGDEGVALGLLRRMWVEPVPDFEGDPRGWEPLYLRESSAVAPR